MASNLRLENNPYESPADVRENRPSRSSGSGLLTGVLIAVLIAVVVMVVFSRWEAAQKATEIQVLRSSERQESGVGDERK